MHCIHFVFCIQMINVLQIVSQQKYMSSDMNAFEDTFVACEKGFPYLQITSCQFVGHVSAVTSLLRVV